MTKSDKNAAFDVVTFQFQVHSGPILGQGAQEYWGHTNMGSAALGFQTALTSYLSS